MSLTLESIEVLDAIARRGSFAQAALELGRVPSALTYTVRRLEEDLDVLLFDRRGHRAKLTPAGSELLEQGRQLLDAAAQIEKRVKQVATGWEPELRIVVDNIVPVPPLLKVCGEFFAEQARMGGNSRVRMSGEVLMGTWESLLDGRADLAIGVSGEPPGGGGVQCRLLGEIAFEFAVAPSHPLADVPEPVSAEMLRRHRAVAIGDTARTLPRRSTGLLSGQEVLTVPDLRAKLEAQKAGLGCGYLPRRTVLPEVRRGTLVIRRTEEAKPVGRIFCAWHSRDAGRALRWFVKRLDDARLRRQLLAGTD